LTIQFTCVQAIDKTDITAYRIVGSQTMKYTAKLHGFRL